MIKSKHRSRSGQQYIVNQRHSRRQVAVNELSIGMFVAELDIPWEESPFLFQGFLLESQEDIQVVQDSCEYVYIDVVEEEWVADHGHAPAAAPRSRTRYVEKQDMAQQLSQANRTYQAAKKQVKQLLASAQMGQALDSQQAQEVVKDCVDRVMGNPNAMLWLTRLKGQDEYTAEHSVNVCLLAISLGRLLDLAPYELENLGMCGLMHDLGKMKVPPEILNKPGPLEPEEFREMARHTVYGKQLLMSRADIYPGAIDVAYSHHERLDGKGYPRGIDSHKISRFTRIVTIVDAYDAMTSDRCYKPGMSSVEALRIVNRNLGTQFDADIARTFISMIGLYPPGYLLEMTNGEVGIILSSNPGFQLKPKVIMILDPAKEPQPERILNLAYSPVDDFGQPYQPQNVYRSGCFGINVGDYVHRGLRIKGFEYSLSEPEQA